jgi:ribulose 1,5-bisphosphate carboxylase large subunit-like protein
MAPVIIVNVSAYLSCDNQPPSEDTIEASIKQCVSDAVEGSFDEYPEHLKPMLRLQARRIFDESRRMDDHSEINFRFGLPSELFPINIGGLQLLVNLLAGDMFPTEALGCRWSNVHVHSLDLPDDLRAEAMQSFRNTAHNIGEIRSSFKLPENRPLIAFSLKPRVGLTFDETKRITLDVLEAGFNIVELDARNLAMRSEPIQQWIELGKEAAQVGAHITAFSPNLSIPAPQLLDVVTEWTTEIQPLGPPVIKVDGGLDGLSSIQAVRQGLNNPYSPVITCYPTLRNQLASAIGDSTWVDFLSLSGADIIYPGGRPTFPNERRPVWGAHVQGWSRAARVYDDMISRQWPMPTIAGGVHPGQLQAFYELVGPKVAYFLGGAVALHPGGPSQGAKLCVEVLNAAIALAGEADASGDDFADDLPSRLLRKVEKTRYPKTVLNYFSPTNIFGAKVSSPPMTFYRRR